MAYRKRVKCINKIDRANPWERITHIGGDGWKLTQQEAIHQIETVGMVFFVRVAGDEVLIVVVESRYGNKFLKTEADGEATNNLLSLPECP